MNIRIVLTALLIFISASIIAQVDRSRKPEPGPAPVIKLGEYSTFTLDNGLKVIIVENHKLPKVTFSLVLDLDPILEGDTAGYISAAGQMMRTGTKTRSKDQLDEEIDFIGADISTSSTGVYASSLKKHLNKITGLLSDVVLNPDFKQEELDKIKRRMQSDIAQSKDDPEAIAGRVSDAVTFASGHPYGEYITEESVDKITLDKCTEYYRTYFRPDAAYLSVVGDISEEEIRPLIEQYFGSWESSKVPEHKYETPQPPDITKVIFVDRPNSVQSVIKITYPLEIKIGDKDEIIATVMNTILGGGDFRLYNNLRETHAYTYGAYSSIRKDKFIGSFTASADVRNQVTDSAVTEILYEMKRIKEEMVTEEELETAKNYISGNFAISLEQPQTIARFALNIERYGLPKDYYALYLKNVAAVNADDIKMAAMKYIKPENAYIVIVGSKDETAKKLSVFGEVLHYDIYGKEKQEEDFGSLNGDDIIEKYIEAIGGRENIENVQDRTTTLEGSIQGIKVYMTSYQKSPDLLRQEINSAGHQQVIIYTGSEGFLVNGAAPNHFVNRNRDVKEITGAELEKLSIEAKLNMLLNLKEAGVVNELTGREKINGRDCYKVEMNFPSGVQWIQYYDMESGFKLKETKPVESPQGSFNQDTYFDDYKEVSGVRYPFKLIQSLGTQKIEMTVISIEVNTGIKEELFKVNE